MIPIKSCQQDLYEGLNDTQMSYAMNYGYEKDDLSSRPFSVKVQGSPTDYPRTITVWAYCREHARDITDGCISVQSN